MEMLTNPYRGAAEEISVPADTPFPSVAVAQVQELLNRCPSAAATPLSSAPGFADKAGVAEVWIKDERGRMGLGSFKALGAAYVIARDAVIGGPGSIADRTYVTASAGNHGLSVAAGARIFGSNSVVYIAETVPESFADRLRSEGAKVVREGTQYEEGMAAAAKAAEDNGWILLSDSSWPGYFERPHRLMEGYLAMMAEVFEEMSEAPSHIFLQAGVGGLAGAAAAIARDEWGDGPRIIVVEPEAAPALIGSIAAGKSIVTEGPVSAMGRLDCKEPSLIALKGLARDADQFVTITEEEADRGTRELAAHGFATTPSGGAGLAALLAFGATPEMLRLAPQSRVLAILSEGPE
ncbi:MAG: pyridoxal-phosphate dependent enzyme [Pseudomonadota bacterium]